MDTDTEVELGCPACGRSGAHEVLRRAGDATVRCSSCGHVHKTRVREPRTVERRVVVSQDGESSSTHTTVRADETVGVDDEFVLETDEGIFGVRVTAVEVLTEDGDDGSETRRVDEAVADDVETVWTEVVDNVTVPVTLHEEDDTVPREMRVPGDYRFVVGETETADGDEFVVTAFVDRRTGDTLRVEGDDVLAKNAKRVYGETV